MTDDVTAQAFREAAAERESNAAYLHRDAENLLAARDRELAGLLLAAASHRDELDRVTAERGKAQAELAIAKLDGDKAQTRLFAIAEALGLLVPETVPYLEDHAKGMREALDRLRADLVLATTENAKICEMATALRAQVATLTAKLSTAVHGAIEEHEGALCPEDMGCKEYIAALCKQVATLTDERDGWKDQVENEHGDLAQCREQRRELRSQVATLTEHLAAAHAAVLRMGSRAMSHSEAMRARNGDLAAIEAFLKAVLTRSESPQHHAKYRIDPSGEQLLWAVRDELAQWRKAK